MQTVSPQFTARTKAPMRYLSWSLKASWNKVFDHNIKFFTIGISTIGGTDIIQGSGAVIQEWDKYHYDDFSNRVISMEYSRQITPPLNAVSQAIADLVLDNTDGAFTPTNKSSPYYPGVTNGRPVKIFIGFRDTELIQTFVGLTQGLPNLDEKARTATFHCIDFISQLANVTLDQTVMATNQRTDQVVSTVLQAAGLSATQFNLDVGTVIIPFAYFDVGQNVLDALSEVATAELGNVSMDETGTIRFVNRLNWASGQQVWSFDRSNVIDITSPSMDTVINQVEVTGNVRAVQVNQSVWSSTSSVVVPANGTLDVFASFSDSNNAPLPVTSLTTPTFNGATSQWLGSSLLSLSTFTNFGTSCKMTFTNSTSTPQTITGITLFGTPAAIVYPIDVLLQDAASVTAYAIRATTVQNDYIQDPSTANSLAQIIISDNSQPMDQKQMDVIGVPQLQLGDLVGYSDRQTKATYFVTKIDTTLNSGGLRQAVTMTQRTIHSYFRIGISTVGSLVDVIAP